LEGDDYWTDPSKLQKQINYLGANPDCSFCFTDCQVEIKGSLNELHPNFKMENQFTGIDFADQTGSIAQTCTWLVRSECIQNLPNWITSSYTVDWCMQIHFSKFGMGGYIPENTSVYRIHDKGVWSKLNEFDAWRKNLCFYRTALGQFSLTDHQKRLRKRIVSTIKDALELANVTADKKEIRYWLKERLTVSPFDEFRQTIQSLLLLAKLRNTT
jgi:hypothetical protein